MVVGESDVHDGASEDLTSDDDWAELGSVHAQDSALRHVDDRGTHHAAEHSTVGDSESTAGHILNSDLTVTSALSQIGERLLELMEAHFLGISDDGNDKTSRSGYSS